MRPVVEILRARGHDVEVTARDFAQTLELCRRLGIEHTAIGRHRGAVARRQGARARLPLDGARAVGAPDASFDLALGHGSNDITVAAKLLGSRARPRSTTSGRRSSTTSTAGWRGASSYLTRFRLRAWTATARSGKLHAYPGLKEEYYLADFEPTDERSERAGARSAGARSRWSAPPRRCRCITASRTTCSDRSSPASRARRPWSCPVPPNSGQKLRQARWTDRPGPRDRRPVADRPRRPCRVRRRDDEPRGGRARHARC